MDKPSVQRLSFGQTGHTPIGVSYVQKRRMTKMTIEEKLQKITDLVELEGFANRRRYFPTVRPWRPDEIVLIQKRKFELQCVEHVVTGQMRRQADAEARRMGKLKNSILGGAGNQAGFLAEIVVANHIGATIKHSYDFDMVLGNVQIDVKSVLSNNPPRWDFNAYINGYYKQKCDWYAFAYVSYDLSRAWSVGYYPSKQFFDDAKFYAAGTPDENSPHVWKQDAYVMPLWRLKGKIDEQK